MAANVIVDAGFIIALLVRRDTNHSWAVAQSSHLPPPWKTCEAALSEAFHLLGDAGGHALAALLERRSVSSMLNLSEEIDDVLNLMRKYDNVPMSLADACLVRMTETLADPVLLTADPDFCIYRRHGRRSIPCILPA